VRRHEISAVIAASKSRRSQPELNDALNMRNPIVADRINEYGSKLWVLADFVVKRHHHFADERLCETGVRGAVLEWC